MFQYTADLSGIPFQPGGDLYAVSAEQGYAIIRNRHAIDGIVVLEKGIGILAFGTLFLKEDEDCLVSLEHAQAWAAAHRPQLPCPYEDFADCWLKTSETLPADSRAVWVMADGMCREAFFEEESKKFYPDEDPQAEPLEQVTEWTQDPDASKHCSILDVQEDERREPTPEHGDPIDM